MISIAEYTARVRRLRTVFPDLDSGYNDDEGLTLVFAYGTEKRRAVLTGETSIVEEAERRAQEVISGAARDFATPVTVRPFRKEPG